MSAPSARLLAIYLPQFHPIPENDAWHGPGFTEWTNVTRARPLFPGHYQPRLPADLGFYDLRLPETREAQAAIAREHGIEGFLYWHYWFGGGRTILERPFREVLDSGRPDFPFCLGWANASWTGVWYGMSDRQLLRQEYPGSVDHERHFYALLPAFRDRRYVRVGGHPLFFFYQPTDLPDAAGFTRLWNALAAKEGLGRMHFVSSMLGDPARQQREAFDAFALLDPFAYLPVRTSLARRLARRLTRLSSGPNRADAAPLPTIHAYEDLVRYLADREIGPEEYPVVVSNYDNTARCGTAGTVLHDSTPERFGRMLADAVGKIAHRDPERRIVLIEAWNEWAEGNHLEPDLRFGRRYLEVVRQAVGA